MRIYGEKGQAQGRWFKVHEGPRMRFHGRWPTVTEWDNYMAGLAESRLPTAKPSEPATPTVDIRKMYAVMRECGAPCITGIEVDGDMGEFSVAMALDLGPYQEPFFDFAGFLFRDSSGFCDEGHSGDEGTAGVGELQS